VSTPKLDIATIFKTWPSCAIALDTENRIAEISVKAIETLGWEREDLIGNTIHDTLCSKDRINGHSKEACRFETSAIRELEDYGSCFFMSREGHSVSLDYRAVPYRDGSLSYLVFFSDNSERLYSQDEMQKFTAMLEQSPSPVVEFDRYGQIVYGNVAFGELLDAYDFNEEGAARVLPTDLEPLCQSLLVDDAKNVISKETSVDNHHFEWHFQTMESSGMEKIIAYGFDITEKVEQQRLMEEEQAKLRKEFLAKMVHELRTPLNAIVGFSDILISRIGESLESAHLKRLKSIKSAGHQLNDMITDTLEFSKIESGQMTVEITEFSLVQMCDAVYEQMRTLAEQKHIEYQHNFLTDKLICSDQNKLRQIVINIVSNAIKYTPEGRVELLLTEVNDYQLGESFKLVVLDTGVGIPEEKIHTLFDSYTKVENIKTAGVQGTGLGLSLVKDMTQLLGGRICVNSIVDQGSVFELVLPKNFQNAA